MSVGNALQYAADNSTRVTGEATATRRPQVRDEGGLVQRVFAPGEGVDDKKLRPGTSDFATQMNWLKSQAGTGTSIFAWRFGKQSDYWDRYTRMQQRLAAHDREQSADAALAISARLNREILEQENEISELAAECAIHKLILFNGRIEDLPGQLGINVTQHANLSADLFARQNIYRLIVQKLRAKRDSISSSNTAGGGAASATGSRQPGTSAGQIDQGPTLAAQEELASRLRTAVGRLKVEHSVIRGRIGELVNRAISTQEISTDEARMLLAFPAPSEEGGYELLDREDREIRKLLIQAQRMFESTNDLQAAELVPELNSWVNVKAANLRREAEIKEFIETKRAQRQPQAIIAPSGSAASQQGSSVAKADLVSDDSFEL